MAAGLPAGGPCLEEICPVRDIVVFLMVFGGLPFAFTRPFFGLLMFSWLAYMRPQDLCWGPARGQRFSLLVAVAMFTGFFIYEKRPFTRWTPQLKWILLLYLWVFLSFPLNDVIWPHRQVGFLIDLAKVFAVAMFTVGLVDDKKRLDLVFWTITLSLGFYGIKGGLFGLLTGGRILQGPGGMLKDNNDLCLAMNMVLPMFFYMGMGHRDLRVRRVCYIFVALTVVTVIITTSRGGMLTLAGVAFLFVMKSRKKLIGLSVGALGLILFLLFLPADVKERLDTLKDPAADGSAAGRLFAWGIAWKMATDNPGFGVGIENFIPKFKFYTPIYLPKSFKGVASVRVTHNSYLQLVAETGFPSLFFFLVMLLSAIFMMRKLRRVSRQRDGPLWIYYYTNMVEVSLLAFMAGAFFLNRSHFDLLYHMVALAGCVYVVGMRALRGEDIGDDGAYEKEPSLSLRGDRPTLATRFR